MGALAGLLKARGDDVRGSDAGVYPPMSDQLDALQIPVMEGYSPGNLDWGPDRVVVGNVCTKDHVEVVAAQERGLPLTSLPAVLGKVFLENRHSLVVAGTHGKTTTASLLTHLLMEAGRDPGCFIGGVPINLGQGWRLGTGQEFVVEGDEYDSAFFDKESKFLHYCPRGAVITSVELDHVDIFSSLEAVREAFRKFVRLIPPDGLLLAAAEPDVMAIARTDARCKVETYQVSGSDEAARAGGSGPPPTAQPIARDEQPDWEAQSIDYLPSGRATFEVRRRGEFLASFETILAGDYNIGNALAAIALAHSVGVSTADLQRGLASFAGRGGDRQTVRQLAHSGPGALRSRSCRARHTPAGDARHRHRKGGRHRRLHRRSGAAGRRGRGVFLRLLRRPP
jgi:UDP-N-acetylmuramate: L-alanyl-gamma-D-glutamyl-meso-diaminopimelate ligase